MSAYAPLRIVHAMASLHGGAARHVIQLAAGLIKQGHDAAIAAPRDNAKVAEDIQRRSIPFYEIPLNAPVPFQAVRSFNRLVQRQRFSIVHVHGLRAACAIRFGRIFGPKKPSLIYTIHGYHAAHYPNILSKLQVNGIESLLAPLTSAFICVSQSTKEAFLRTAPNVDERCYVIENAIEDIEYNDDDKQSFREQYRHHFDIPSESYVIGTVARLQWQKGVDRLIDAFAAIRDELGGARLLIVGDGPDRVDLMRRAEDAGVGETCIFAGFMPEPEKIYPAMDLFALPSLWEGLPLTILEAWRAGIPVAATDVEGNRDMIQDGVNGFLGHDSVQGIVDALRRALSLRGDLDSMIQNARNELHNCFSLSYMLERTESIYWKYL